MSTVAAADVTSTPRITNHNQIGRPPKPAAVPFGGCSSSVSGENNDLNDKVMRDVSERSRASLKESIQKRRRSRSLTVAEEGFLVGLMEQGDEVELQLAYEKLMDDELFFPMMDESEPGWRDEMILIGNGRDASVASELGEAAVEITNLHSVMNDESCRSLNSFTSTTNLGSEQRQLSLQQRRNSLMHGKIWRAHESGLAISQSASRRSVQSRRSSLSQLWQHPHHQTNTIFRESTLMDQHNSDNRSKNQFRPLRPVLRRMQSEGSRKSVTFSIPPAPRKFGLLRDDSSIPSIQSGHPIASPSSVDKEYGRSNSISSLPPIMHGHSIYERSGSIGSIANSIASYPSIHEGNPVSSPQASVAASIPPLHRAHSVHSTIHDDSAASDITLAEVPYDWLATANFEEKKTPDELSDSVKLMIPGEAIAFKNISPITDNVLQDATKLLHKNDSDAPDELLVPALSASMSSDHQQQTAKVNRPILLREASANEYNGVGVEVSDWLTERESVSFDRQLEPAPSAGESLVSFGGSLTIKTSNSFDERMSYQRVGNIFRRAMNRRQSMSEDSLNAGIIIGGNRLFLKETSSLKDVTPTDDDSWKLGDEEDGFCFDSWKVIEDEYENGYGGGDSLPFRILGTSADDINAHPHVLSPPLMESLQAFLPLPETGSNFWMKYSLVRDGASMYTFLQHARGAKCTILAIETLEGEVFGAFCTEAWRKNWKYFGTGESFLWKMRKTRQDKCNSIIDQAQLESEIDVYPFTGANHCIQLCTQDKIAIGGGNHENSPASSPIHDNKRPNNDNNHKEQVVSALSSDWDILPHEWGFGLTVEGDFLHGTTSPCMTFANPSLSKVHPNGKVFEIMNLELWTLTPCTRLEDAEKLELGILFLEQRNLK